MFSRNLDPLAPFRWLEKLGIEELCGPFTFISNGDRGHLHTGRRCSKVASSKVRKVDRVLTASVAANVELCDQCVSSHNVISTAPDEDTRNLLTTGVQIWQVAFVAETTLSLNSQPTDEMSAYASFKRLLTKIDRLRSIEIDSRLENARQAALAHLEQEKASATVDPELVFEQVIRRVACTRMRREALDQAFYDTPSRKTLLRALNTKTNLAYSFVATVFDAWQSEIGSGGDVAARVIANLGDSVVGQLTNPATQLADVPALWPSPGESALEVARRSYGTFVSELLGSLLAEWGARYREFLAARRPTAVAHYDRFDSFEKVNDPLSLVVQDAIVARNGKKVLVQLPEILAAEFALSHASSRVSNLVPLESDMSAAAAETAITLWEPFTDGVYQTLERCITAAELL